MTNPKEKQPAGVPEKAKQVGEISARWCWVEPSVWTERMLSTLEDGVKGGVWFSLIDKVYDKRNLHSSFRKVKSNKGKAGVDHVGIGMFEKQLEENIEKLHQVLKASTYNPQKILRVEIPKPGSKSKRPLGIPTVRDRVAQTSLRNVLEPIFEATFSGSSYGFRPGRSCKDALREVDRLLKEGYLHVVDADIRSYFDSIDHERLLLEVREQVADGRVLKLIEMFLKQEIMEELRQWIPERGTPQGGVISPLLANIYLNKFDHYLERKGYRLVRYADDFVVLCKKQDEAEVALWEIEQWMKGYGLELHPDKTRLVDMNVRGAGFDFLGYHFVRTERYGNLKHWPSMKSMKNIRCKIKPYAKRCNGHSFEAIIKQINPILRGWYEYYRHSPNSTLKAMDGWVRMRLRSILRKRRGGKGRGRGQDHNRWPNAFFALNGLFSMLTTRYEARQSFCR
jgi:RNA-directed DNA polymerase